MGAGARFVSKWTGVTWRAMSLTLRVFLTRNPSPAMSSRGINSKHSVGKEIYTNGLHFVELISAHADKCQSSFRRQSCKQVWISFSLHLGMVNKLLCSISSVKNFLANLKAAVVCRLKNAQRKMKAVQFIWLTFSSEEKGNSMRPLWRRFYLIVPNWWWISRNLMRMKKSAGLQLEKKKQGFVFRLAGNWLG